MTIAVFAFFPEKASGVEDGLWLNHLLMAMGDTGEGARVVIFTNKPQLLPAVHTAIEKADQKATPKLLLVRYRYLRLWQKKIKALGADALLCWGPQSFIVTGIPTFVFVPPTVPGLKMSAGMKAKLQSAAGALVTRQKQKEILEKYGAKQVWVVPGGPIDTTSSVQSPDAVKAQYTQDCEYFLYMGSFADKTAFISLLKAFSRFKRRQKTSWKLVLVPAPGADVAKLQQALSNYKYRSEVIMPDMAFSETEMAALFSAAYAFVQPVSVAPYGRYLMNALQAGLPVISLNDQGNKELAQDAALYFDAGDEELLAAHLMLLYKDEAFRGRLAGIAQQKGVAFSWRSSATQVWKAITHSVE